MSSLFMYLSAVCVEISIISHELALMMRYLLLESGLVLVSRDKVELIGGIGS